MAVKEFSWNTNEGKEIYAVEWPAESARAVVGLIHGVGEHCRRYDHLAEFFNHHHIGMVGYDREGYGRSEGKRGYTSQFSNYVDTIAHLVIECARRYPDLPIFLYGHSLGGNLLLRYLIKRHPDISGAIASAPYVQLSFQPNPITVGLGRMMRLVWSTFTQSNPLDTSKLSRDPEVEKRYLADPLVHDKISARTGMDLLESAQFLDEYSGTIARPLLLMHGSDDGLTSFLATKSFYERVKGKDMTFKEWPGFYHELHNEPEKAEVFRYVLEWMEPRINKADTFRTPKSI